MSAQEVRNTIIRGFSDKIGEKSKIAMLMADPKFHVLTKVDEREGGADAADVFELAGQGSLFVRITVSFTCNTYVLLLLLFTIILNLATNLL